MEGKGATIAIMAYTTIHRHLRMTDRHARCVGPIMTIGAYPTGFFEATVINVCVCEGFCSMTEPAVNRRINVTFNFSDGHCTVVTGRTGTINSAMIVATIFRSVYKRPGIVTIVTLSGCHLMKYGFGDGGNAVMALATFTEYFLVIHEGDV